MLTYWEIQMQATLNLELLGISWSVNQRIPLFKMRQRLLKLMGQKPNNELLVSDTLFLLDELVKMRAMGYETRHKEGKYY